MFPLPELFYWLEECYHAEDWNFILVETHGTSSVADEQLEAAVRAVFGLTPRGIIETLGLRRPIYRQTAAYGHFGCSEFSWEQTDAVERLRAQLA